MNDEPAYVVATVETGFEVRAQDGRALMACRDEPSARHYASMLSAAFDAGFRQGYQAAMAER